MCVRSYNASVRGGIISESLISTAKKWPTMGDLTWRMLSLDCAGVNATTELISLGYAIEPNITE